MNVRAKFVALAALLLAGGCALRASSGPFATNGAGFVERAGSAERAVTARSLCGRAPGIAHCHVMLASKPASGAPTGAPAGYAPADLQAAYSLPAGNRGEGYYVAVVSAYDNPNVANDLTAYRTQFGLPAGAFAKYDQRGNNAYPTGNESWGAEIDTAVEMVAASCPRCSIVLVEADGDDWPDLGTAVAEAARLGAHVVVAAFGGKGGKKSQFAIKHVTYLASGGDPVDTEPAAFPTVVAVGGTTLERGGGSRGWTETPYGSGGCTKFKPPMWQHDPACATREVNDVAAVADPATPVAVFDSYGLEGWVTIGGTSVAAPLLAGVFGLAGNGADQVGGRTFWSSAHQRHLYEVGGVRYSQAAGWGSPDGIGAF